MPDNLIFNPDQVAYFEKAGWEAYYDRNWPRVLWLMVQLNREQFRMPWLAAVAAALDVVRASGAFAPLAPRNDIPAAVEHLCRYYEKARRYTGIQADAQTLAMLEIDYWVVHRNLAGERKQAPDHAGDIELMTAALERLHSALFTAAPEAIRRSAELRAEAARTVDRITGGYSTDPASDWKQVEAYLRQAYHQLR